MTWLDLSFTDRVGFVPVATIIVALHLILFFDATSSNTDVVTTSTAVPFFASPDDDLPHGTEGYFDGTAFVILQTSLDIRRVTSLGFRTCTSQGLLFYQSGARGDSLKLELVAGGKLRMFWIVSGIEGSVESGQGLDDNKWHQASLSYASGNVHLGLDNLETLVANDSHHSELLRLDLSSPNPEVVVGQGYEGCLLQGAGLVFQDVSVTSVGVNWTTCPLPKRGGCGKSF